MRTRAAAAILGIALVASMTFALRSLRAGGITSPVLAGMTLTAAPIGGFNPWTVPNAVYANGKTYFGWVNGSSGDVGVASYSDTGVLAGPYTLHAAFEADEHIPPALLVRDSDQRILAFYSKHNNVPFNLKISTNPSDVSSWGSATDLDSQLGGTRYTDYQVHQLLAETNDPIYLFYRDEPSAGTDSRWCYSKSTDGGATWATQTILYRQASSRSYFISWSDGAGRIHFLASSTGAGTHWGHFYYDGGAYYNSAGVNIGSPPFDYTDLTEVWNGNPAAAMNIVLDSSGYPVVALWETEGDGVTHNAWYLRWDGSAWNQTEVAGDTGGYAYEAGSSNAYDAAIDDGDPNVMYVIQDVGSQPELFRYQTADDGATFSSQQLTSGSSSLQRRITTVRNRGDVLRALWLSGSWTDFNDYSMGILGTTR
jgi:hypothetical protein